MHRSALTRELASSANAVARAVVVAGFLFAADAPSRAQETETETAPSGPAVEWVVGPAKGDLGGTAEVEVPEGFVFAGPDDTRKILEAMENPVDGSERGFLAPQNEGWFVVFQFSDIGYVKDAAEEKLDAEALLESLQEGNRETNKARSKRGWETVELTGWFQPPHFDVSTHNLEWATRLKSSQGESINYNTRLLGRRGVMSATLVGDEAEVRDNLESFKSLLGGYRFVQNEDYASFQPGDKIAKYGLAALITGGAAAVALKTGLFQKLWKLIVVAVVGGLAGLRKLFARRNTGEGGTAPA